MKLITGCVALLAMLMNLPAQGQNPHDAPASPEPPMLGAHWARGAAAAGGQAGSSPLLISHGGGVMHTSVTLPIYWGASWSDVGFVQDKMSGLAQFYSTEGGSAYAATSNEYTDSTGSVTSASTYLGSIVDLSASTKNGNRTSPILQEVCTALAAHGVTPVANGYYPVYVDTPRGHAGFCAWHSWGSCGGVPIQFAFFFNLDGDAGCDPEDTSGLHSQGLAALANVSGHELSEARTDPRGTGWYDASGEENADKCAWAFGTPLLSFTGKSQWKIQGNWSNAAFNAGTGYPNRSGQSGCLDGGNFK